MTRYVALTMPGDLAKTLAVYAFSEYKEKT